jgi:metallophosphoesterase (TIGR03767 family)
VPSQAATSLQQTLRQGKAQRQGRLEEYRTLAYGPGEPRLVRQELASLAPAPARELVSLLHIGHLTDLQLADVQSPGRFEFFERLRGTPGAEAYVPSWRPQEALAPHAIAAMVATLSSSPLSAETGAPLGLCISTGDSLDNAQLNELRWFLTLLAGGTFTPNSGGAAYQGAQSAGWSPRAYWSPEPGPDPFKEGYGFPTYPGLLSEALQPLSSPGLSTPWLSCFGNHDGLVLGTALPTSSYEEMLLGAMKPFDLPAGAHPLSMVEEFTSRPELLLCGPGRRVEPDPERQTIGRRQFVAAHLDAGGAPAGHGFQGHNVQDETAYGFYDIDGPVPLRVVILDTTNLDGDFQGSIGLRQCRWLEERLIEVHSRHFGPDGSMWATGARDRLVVLASHHGLATMVNQRRDPAGLETDHPRLSAATVEPLLHRFGNVVLWLNGHRHVNDVQPRPDPSGRTGGFWEVSTASIADWPCQSRLVELATDGSGGLVVLGTMLDSAAPADPGLGQGPERLASLHRELASNHPHAGARSSAAGRPDDRNVALVVPSPFPFG